LKVYYSIGEFNKPRNAVVTIGTFDGVHKGHQKIIQRINEIAGKEGGETVVLTFFPHPRMVLHPDDHGLQLLNTLDEKVELMEHFGVQHLIIYPFTKSFSRTSVTEYVRNLLVNKIGTKKLVIGYDHHFGRNRAGSLKNLRELAPVYGYGLEEIPEQDINNIAISSTKIRNSLLEGDVQTAADFLGYNYNLTGTVTEGKKIGRSLGFPTANILLKENYKLIPAKGIYAVEVKINHEKFLLKGALSIGNRPTFDNGPLSIEVNIFDFDRDIYGEKITVYFRYRLRNEIKFNSTDDLIVQMKKDKKRAEELMK